MPLAVSDRLVAATSGARSPDRRRIIRQSVAAASFEQRGDVPLVAVDCPGIDQANDVACFRRLRAGVGDKLRRLARIGRSDHGQRCAHRRHCTRRGSRRGTGGYRWRRRPSRCRCSAPAFWLPILSRVRARVSPRSRSATAARLLHRVAFLVEPRLRRRSHAVIPTTRRKQSNTAL